MTTPDLPQISDERIKKLIPKCDAWRYEVGHDEAVSFARAIIAERDAQWLTRLGAVAELQEAAKGVLAWRHDTPTTGYLRDNDASRNALRELAKAVNALEAKE